MIRSAFDANWYLERYPDVAKARVDPLAHYLEQGAREGRDPCPLFDTDWYLRQYADVAKSGVNPLIDYLEQGARQGRDPCPLFDSDWYLEQYPDVAESGVNPLIHYLSRGASEGRDPCALFDTDWYQQHYPEVEMAGINPLGYYLHTGRFKSHAVSRFHDVVLLDDLLAGAQFKAAERLFAIMDPAPLTTSPTRVIRGPLTTVSEQAERSGSIVATSDELSGRLAAAFPSSTVAPQAVVTPAFPRPYLARLENVLMLPGSAALIDSAGRIMNDEFAWSYAKFQSEPKLDSIKRAPNNEVIVRFKDKLLPIIDRGIHLCKEHDKDFCRWVVEVLPRQLMAEMVVNGKSIPVIVSAGLDQNYYDLLDCVKDPGRPIIRVEAEYLYRVSNLYYPSDVSRINDVSNEDPSPGNVHVAVDWVRAVVHTVRTRLPVSSGTRRRRLYLRQEARDGNLLNGREIEETLVARGFEIVDAAPLSIRTQVSLFEQAEIVVGPTGAALANIIWCGPSTPVVILHSDHPGQNLVFWDQLAEVSSAKLTYVSGPRAYSQTGKRAVDDGFRIPVAMVLQSIDLQV